MKKRSTPSSVAPKSASRLAAAPGQPSGPTRFSEIKVPAALRTSLATGNPHMDTLFTGEGIRPSTCCLVTGEPGRGKTTLMLQLADSLAGQGHLVLFNSCEENSAQVFMNAEKRGLKNILNPSNNIWFSSYFDVTELLEWCETARKTHGKNLPKGRGVFLIEDSLQTMERTEKRRGRPASKLQQQADAVWDIASWAKEHMTCALIIGQVTKDGEFAGKQEVKHAIDVHMHLYKDKDRKSDTFGRMILENQKNRMGTSGLYFPYTFGKNGIQFDDA